MGSNFTNEQPGRELQKRPNLRDIHAAFIFESLLLADF
jgi:hypothetical protein